MLSHKSRHNMEWYRQNLRSTPCSGFSCLLSRCSLEHNCFDSQKHIYHKPLSFDKLAASRFWPFREFCSIFLDVQRVEWTSNLTVVGCRCVGSERTCAGLIHGR